MPATIRRPILGQISETFDFDEPGKPFRSIDCEIHFRVTPRESAEGRYPGCGPTNEILRVVPRVLHVLTEPDEPDGWDTYGPHNLPAGETVEKLAQAVTLAIGASDLLAERIDWACLRAAGEV